MIDIGTGGTGDGDHGGENGAVAGGSDAGTGGSSAGRAGDGGAAGVGGSTGTTCRPVLPVTYRDFNPFGSPMAHDDFEASARGVKNADGSTFQGWNDMGCGLVEPTLGADGKPRVFTGEPDAETGLFLPGIVGRQRRVVSGPGCAAAGAAGDCRHAACQQWNVMPPTYSIKSRATFAHWFNTVPGTNIEISGELSLFETIPGSGIWRFASNPFFPIDGQGFGNSPGLAHNYSFTTEAHVKFTYLTGQQIKFRGDDDLWIFVNGKLAIDLGGQHQPLSAAVDLDAQAPVLGIVPGQTYALDLFHAERQSTISTFDLTTNIACFEPR